MGVYFGCLFDLVVLFDLIDFCLLITLFFLGLFVILLVGFVVIRLFVGDLT